jgi:hypothetical protein
MMSASNFAEDIEAAVGEEEIEAIVISPPSYFGGYGDKDRPSPVRYGVALTWVEARPMLDYKYDDGFGLQDCDDVYVYTATRVLYVHEYDGSTRIAGLPRHPTHAYASGEEER